MLAPRTASVTCLDISARVVQTNRERLDGVQNVHFVQGDMHELPFEDAHFDHALLLSSLAYTRDPVRVLTEAARVLVPGGRLSSVSLTAHEHAEIVRSYGHLNNGFTPEQLSAFAAEAGLDVHHCGISGRQRRPPHFETITLYATRQSTLGAQP